MYICFFYLDDYLTARIRFSIMATTFSWLKVTQHKFCNGKKTIKCFMMFFFPLQFAQKGVGGMKREPLQNPLLLHATMQDFDYCTPLCSGGRSWFPNTFRSPKQAELVVIVFPKENISTFCCFDGQGLPHITVNSVPITLSRDWIYCLCPRLLCRPLFCSGRMKGFGESTLSVGLSWNSFKARALPFAD